jgi:hypothetical protein
VLQESVLLLASRAAAIEALIQVNCLPASREQRKGAVVMRMAERLQVAPPAA